MFKLAQEVYQSGYGFNHGGWHRGIDYRDKATPNSTVYSPFKESKIIHIGEYPIYGKTVAFQDLDTGNIGFYAHMKDINAQLDDLITPDKPVGITGSSGLAPGAEHLHAELLKGDALNVFKSGKFNPNNRDLMQYAINNPDIFKTVFKAGQPIPVSRAPKAAATFKSNPTVRNSMLNIAQKAGFKVIGNKIKLV